MKNAVILGANSDIANGIMPLLEADGWRLTKWARDTSMARVEWDLVFCALGSVAPVGPWHETLSNWGKAFDSNLFLPLRLLHLIWQRRGPDAAVCFLAGSNPNMIMNGYGAYNVSKMALLKAVEQIDAESPDVKLFALGPGTVLTKIHEASDGWENPKLAAARAKGEDREQKIQAIYDCLKWCIAQRKEVIGGRNICVSDSRNEQILRHQDSWKLRRAE